MGQVSGQRPLARDMVRARRLRTRLVVGGAVVALFAAACIPVKPPVDPPEPPSPNDPCHSMAIGTCGLPFPSDEWTVADPNSPTGLRVAVPDEVVPPELREQLPDSFSPSVLFDDSDGFSAAGPIVFELPTSFAPGTLPDGGGDAVVVYDLDTGERVPVRVHESKEGSLRGRHGTIVQAWSRTHWDWGHTYVAAVTTDLYKQAGGPFAAKADGGDPDGRGFLESMGFGADRIVSTTTFTVRTEADATSDLDAMATEVRAQDHPVRNLRARPNFLFLNNVSTIVTGQVRITDFRDDEGQVRYEPGDTGTQRWVDFTMTIPSKRLAGGSPMAIYGHGLGIFKESMVVVSGQNAYRGITTVSIDQPNHGSRQGADGGYIFQLVQPSQVDRLTGIITQSPLDHLSLLLAVESELGDLDAAPFNLFDPLNADGVADLDTDRILYEGTSLGGVLGMSFVGIAPELDGAGVHVAGVGITSILSESIFWEIGLNQTGTGFRGVIPTDSTAGEAAMLAAAVQHEVDHGDAINFVERIPELGTPTLDLYSIGDGLVPNYSSEAFAALAELPLYDRVLVPIPDVPHAGPTLPADGTGIWQIDSSNVPQFPGGLSAISDLLEHVQFIQNRSIAQFNTWLDQRLAAAP